MNHDAPHSDPRLEDMLSGMDPAEALSLREVWHLAGDAAPVSSEERSAAWQRLDAVTAAPVYRPLLRPVLRPALRLMSVRRVRQFAVAASVVLVAAVGYLAMPQDTTYRADAGDQRDVLLADGSRVVLAPGSELRVRDGFGTDARTVRLEGEGYFDITPAAEHAGLSFRIETFNAAVEVVGTAFNVRARQSDILARTEVAVEHGVVRVQADDSAVELLAGQGTLVSLDAAPRMPSPVDVVKATAWRSGGLAFDAVPMGVVFAELERRYALRIEAPVSIARLEVSYWRESPADIGDVLADLADVVDAEIRQTANGYQVYRLDR